MSSERKIELGGLSSNLRSVELDMLNSIELKMSSIVRSYETIL